MQLHVLAEVGTRDEFLVTDLTHVRLLSTVDPPMPYEITHLRELPVAYLTNVRLHLHVDALLMLLQGGVLNEAFSTVWTDKGFFACMSPLMLLESLLATKHSHTITNLAGEFLWFGLTGHSGLLL